MYHEFYALQESPFTLTPDPKYLFMSEAHEEALASMSYGVHERKGFVLILGEVGTGKTTLVRHVLAQSDTHIKTAYVFQTVTCFEDLLLLVLRDLEIACRSRQRLAMIDTLNDYLLQEASAGHIVVLILDEAQNLPVDILEELRLLSNLETSQHKLLQIILVGQPELGEKLGRPELRQLRQRIGLVAQLKPLTRRQTAQYVQHRLRVAGYEEGILFNRRAVKQIQRASGGIPRLINVICDQALVLGYGANARQINGRIIKEVVKDWAVFGRGGMASSPVVSRVVG